MRPGSVASFKAIVAIPANNEAERITACLAALATQRDLVGAPIEAGAFEILVYANNCSDRTAAVAREISSVSPHPIRIVTETLPPDQSNAGWARKRAMDLAAARLAGQGRHDDGIILTTDADSLVAPTWLSATLHEFRAGADCVAGYIDAVPAELLGLGTAFLGRGRLEDHYLRLVAEIHARCDPRPHDPWPNHRVSSGASLAVTLAAYLTVGGLPPKPVGEDAALTSALESAGLKVRHAFSVTVATSCRFDGRAKGGAADTMRHRHAIDDAPCDDGLEPAIRVLRRALCKGMMRRAHERGTLAGGDWPRRLGLSEGRWTEAVADTSRLPFEQLWARIEPISSKLAPVGALRPADLAREITRADMLLRWLRDPAITRRIAGRADRLQTLAASVSVAA